jgi:hypothetical protein
MPSNKAQAQCEKCEGHREKFSSGSEGNQRVAARRESDIELSDAQEKVEDKDYILGKIDVIDRGERVTKFCRSKQGSHTATTEALPHDPLPLGFITATPMSKYGFAP